MNYSARSPSLQRLDARRGKRLGCQLKLRGVTHGDVAATAGRPRPAVTNVLCGRTSNLPVYRALCAALGCASTLELLCAAKGAA